MALTLRLDDDTDKALAIVSAILHKPKTEIIQEAVDSHLKELMRDAGLHDLLVKYVNRLNEFLDTNGC